MPYDSFLLSLVLSFIVGSIWVTFVTVIAEKIGSAVGGVVGGLPSTVAFSFLFIGLTQTPNTVVQMTTVYPLAFSLTIAFLMFYAFFAKKGFFVGLSLSLLIWFSTASLIVISGIRDFMFSLIVGITVCIATYYILAKRLNLKNLTGRQTHYKTRQLFGRGVLAGTLVFLAVLISQIGGPTLGGIFSAFPAVYTSTLYILNKSRGAIFSRAMTKPLVLSGILTIIPYCIAVRYTYPLLGIWIGTMCSYAIATPLAFLSYRITLTSIPKSSDVGSDAK